MKIKFNQAEIRDSIIAARIESIPPAKLGNDSEIILTPEQAESLRLDRMRMMGGVGPDYGTAPTSAFGIPITVSKE